MAATGEHFHLLPDSQAEYSIEMDPREAPAETIAVLRRIGFNRISIGVQDFDARVQKATHRVQSFEVTRDTMLAARQEGFRSISADLIYGLPHQSVESFSRTLDSVIELAPDRLSVFGYAHMPNLFKMQRLIDETALPSPAVRLAILQRVIAQLTEAGYVHIGMDHFALPGDELAISYKAGTLQRNFQGYSTQPDCDMIGFGVSSISKVGDVYAQNAKDIPDYEQAIDHAKLAISRGIRLTADDLLRRDVISTLMCQPELRFDQIEALHNVTFASAFSNELERLQPMADDGLIQIQGSGIRIRPAGRMLIRNIAMVFDRYLAIQSKQLGTRFSRTV